MVVDNDNNIIMAWTDSDNDNKRNGKIISNNNEMKTMKWW